MEVSSSSRKLRFGALEVNECASERRGKIKFFDSADWAMSRSQSEEIEEPQVSLPTINQIDEMVITHSVPSPLNT